MPSQETIKANCPSCGRILKARSGNQNRYLWSVLYKMIADETGHSSEEIHEAMKSLFLPRSFFLGDKAIDTQKSTTELSTVEMEEYCQRIRAFAAESLSLILPLPNEYLGANV